MLVLHAPKNSDLTWQTVHRISTLAVCIICVSIVQGLGACCACLHLMVDGDAGGVIFWHSWLLLKC